MLTPVIPANEEERLEALRAYKILDTPAEEAFDELTKLATQLTGAPIALVSLIDANRQWFKSKQGLDACETSRDISFCGHAIHLTEPLEITNALEDSRFEDNPLVTGPPHIRYYLGIPLANPNGFNLGTLCVIDRAPRKLDERTIGMIKVLANQVVSQLELRLAAREMRRQATLAKEASRAKSSFLANMSHEIRTPMNAVIGMTDILLDGHREGELGEGLELIKTSANSLLHLINDILDHAKIEAGKMDLEAVPFDLNHQIEQVLAINSIKAKDRGLELRKETPQPAVPLLLGDPLRLKQVLINLLSNGIKFTAQGSVTILVKEIGRQAGNCFLSFCVRDTGVGIPKDKIGSILKAFTQVDESTTRKYGGTGLGLTISAQLVDIMGGKLSISSTEGEGTEISFTLPFALAPESQTEAPEPFECGAPQESGPAKILVVEDNRVNQVVIRRMLEKDTHEVQIAENSEEALKAFRQQHYGLIFMDVQLPGVDGIETTRLMRELEDGDCHTPIIALTAHAMKEDKDRCLESGMDDFLPKPFTKKILEQIMGKYLPKNGLDA